MTRLDTPNRKYYTPPSKTHYTRIRDACIESLAGYVGTHKDRLRIELKLPAYVRLPKSFPKPTHAKNLEEGFSYNVQEVLDWLHEKGFSDVSSKDIATARYSFAQITRRLEETFLDIAQDVEDNSDIDDFEEE